MMFNTTVCNPRKALAGVVMTATATAARYVATGVLLALVAMSTSGTTYPEQQEYQCRIFVDWLELDLFFDDHYHSHSSHNPEDWNRVGNGCIGITCGPMGCLMGSSPYGP